jgi:large subunit ribosomal protein L25
MLKAAKLKASPRSELGTRASKACRKAGQLPAVLYGHKAETCALLVDARELGLVLKQGARFLELQLPDRVEQAVIKELQHDPISSTVIHVDFARVSMDEVVTVKVPLKLKGHSVGVLHGGALEQHLAEITVKCLPVAIPKFIEADISNLEIGAILHVSAIKAPEGIVVAENPEHVVVTIHEPRKEEVVEVAAAAAPGPAEPEVITAKKEAEKPEEEETAAKKKKSEKGEKS